MANGRGPFGDTASDLGYNYTGLVRRAWVSPEPIGSWSRSTTPSLPLQADVEVSHLTRQISHLTQQVNEQSNLLSDYSNKCAQLTVEIVEFRKQNYDLRHQLNDFRKKSQHKKVTVNEPMANLYSVVTVTKKREIIVEKSVVADDEAGAAFVAGVYTELTTRNLTPSDVTTIATLLGQVKVDKEPDRVRVIKEE